MEFLLPEEAAPITSRGNCTPSSSPTLTTSPTHPLTLTKPREPPFPCSLRLSTLYLRHQLLSLFPSPSSPCALVDALHPWYRRRSIDALCGRLEMIYRKLESWRLSIVTPSSTYSNHKTCVSILPHVKLYPLTVIASFARHWHDKRIKREWRQIIGIYVSRKEGK